MVRGGPSVACHPCYGPTPGPETRISWRMAVPLMVVAESPGEQVECVAFRKHGHLRSSISARCHW
jgi:hypothetical protein